MLSNIDDVMSFAIDRCRRVARKAVIGPQLKRIAADDLMQDLLVAVIKAVPHFDATAGTVEQFFGSVIDDALKEIRRRESGPKARSQRAASISHEPVDPATDSPDRTPELVAHVQLVISTAPPEEQEIARFVGTAKVSAAARALGISRSDARTLLNQLGRRFDQNFFDRFANWDSARRGKG